MTYETTDGFRYVITKHTQEEWAAKVKAQLEKLECSKEYVDKLVGQYLVAKPINVEYGFRYTA